MGFKVTEVQSTPNPNALKFFLDRPISDGPVSFLKADQAAGHVAAALFAVEGVASVLLLGDFVTINKTPAATWPDLKKKVKAIFATLPDTL